MQRQQQSQDNSYLVHSIQPERAKPPAQTTHPLLARQQALGNQAMQRLARTCPLFPGRCPFGGACHTCPARVQAKLTVNQPGDGYEQEADRVADQVMRMPESQVQRQEETPEEAAEESIQTKPLAARITPLVQRQAEPEEEEEEPIQTRQVSEGQIQRHDAEPEEEEEEPTQTKAVLGHTPVVTPAMQAQITALRGGGQPLPASTRAFFEPRFGADFSGVRVHTDARAADTARALNARAYTVGRDVVFGAGQYAPETVKGRMLLAHELTHVVQTRTDKASEKIVRRQTSRIVGIPAEQILKLLPKLKISPERPEEMKPSWKLIRRIDRAIHSLYGKNIIRKDRITTPKAVKFLGLAKYVGSYSLYEKARGRLRPIDPLRAKKAKERALLKIPEGFTEVTAGGEATNITILKSSPTLISVLAHEAVHYYASPSYWKAAHDTAIETGMRVTEAQLGESETEKIERSKAKRQLLIEGMTEYFTLQLYTQGKLKSRLAVSGYDAEVKQVAEMAKKYGEDTLRQAYFAGDKGAMKKMEMVVK